jgi:phenylacetic acid degradation protein/carnitine operon protein CaiE
MIYAFEGFVPVVHPSAFVHPQAVVTGNVIIGEKVYIGHGAAIRGDWGKVVIENGCNVQENCTIHMFPGTSVLLKKGAHIGHGAVVHGAEIGENSLIGMNAVIMDNAVIGKECIIGALAMVVGETQVPDRTMMVGNPAKAVKTVSDEMIEWKTKGTKLYQKLPADCKKSLRPCEPLTAIEKDRPEQMPVFETWKKTLKKK